MQHLTHLIDIVNKYDAILLDLWGVIHDGTQLYPESEACLRALHEQEKQVLFISNAPRRAAKAEQVLLQLGLSKELYSGVVTSGEVAYQVLEEGQLDLPETYFFIGPDRDADVFDGLPYRRVEDIAQAGFLLNVGFGSEGESSDDWKPILQSAREHGLSMLCLNPDMEVVKMTGERFACAGVIAQAYRKLGGEVLWFGKPYPEIYERCLMKLEGVDKRRVLAVGDSLHTDVLGANQADIESVLVTSGIMHAKLKDKTPEELKAYFMEEDIRPDYIMPLLAFAPPEIITE